MKIPTIGEFIIKNIKSDEYSRYLSLLPSFKEEQTQKYITVILTITASIILTLFAISPTLSTIVTLRKQLADDTFVEHKLQDKISALSSLQQQYSGLQADLPLIYAAIPSSSQMPLLLAQIQGVSNESGVVVTNLQTFQDENSSKVAAAQNANTSYGVSFTTEGSYENVLKFLDRIVNIPRIITLDEITVGRTSRVEENSSPLQISVKGKAYFKN